MGGEGSLLYASEEEVRGWHVGYTFDWRHERLVRLGGNVNPVTKLLSRASPLPTGRWAKHENLHASQ